MLHCRNEGSSRRIAGIVVPWDQTVNVLGKSEVFKRGAFQEQFSAGVPPVLLHFQHSVEQIPIGRLATVEDRNEGLWGDFILHSGPQATEAWHAARDGIVDGFSVGFVTPTSRGRGGQGVVTRAAIDHVALTHAPTYAAAKVAETRTKPADRRTLLERQVRRLAEEAR